MMFTFCTDMSNGCQKPRFSTEMDPSNHHFIFSLAYGPGSKSECHLSNCSKCRSVLQPTGLTMQNNCNHFTWDQSPPCVSTQDMGTQTNESWDNNAGYRDEIDQHDRSELELKCERIAARLLELADEFQAEIYRVQNATGYFNFGVDLIGKAVSFLMTFVPRI